MAQDTNGRKTYFPLPVGFTPIMPRGLATGGAAGPGSQHVDSRGLQALAELYQQGQVSDLMNRTLEKLLHHEAEQCQALLRQLQGDLAEFEQTYQLSSAEF